MTSVHLVPIKCGVFQSNVDRIFSDNFAVMMRYNKISEQDKQRLYDAHNRGEDYVALANQLNIKRSTAWAIISRAERNGGRVTRPRGGLRQQRKKVTEEIVTFLLQIINEHPEYTLQQLSDEVQLHSPDQPRLSIATISRICQGQLITIKKLEDAPQERNSNSIKDQRASFANWLMQHGLQNELVFIDESGINLWCKRSRGRSFRGERAVRVVNGRRGYNLTMTFAVSHLNGLVHHDLQSGAMTCDSFKQFLENLTTRLSRDVTYTFIFDNAPAHRRASDANLPGNITLRWLPPYSPFLNIVENCFSMWKSRVKRQLAECRSQILSSSHDERTAILSNIAEQCASVSSEEASSFFRHLQSYLPKCFTRENILM